ncbi:MAG: HEPN domain protein [Candidatus Alkanophagales archaeon MCA70_species_1]|nr:HEPN domain protein [Candidatus Alkanophaga volatiphilum]
MRRERDWLREAEAEFEAARDLYAHGHWSWCCFTCQQAAEKALKALAEHFREPKFGHNLNMLIKELGRHTSIPEDVRGAAARLNRYYIPTRYPNAFDRGAPADQFFEEDAQQALEDARGVIEFVRTFIKEVR